MKAAIIVLIAGIVLCLVVAGVVALSGGTTNLCLGINRPLAEAGKAAGRLGVSAWRGRIAIGRVGGWAVPWLAPYGLASGRPAAELAATEAFDGHVGRVAPTLAPGAARACRTALVARVVPMGIGARPRAWR